MKVKCTFGVLTMAMEQATSGEKWKESEKMVEMNTSLRGGEKHKQMKKTVANATSTKEIEIAMGGFSVAWPSSRHDPVMLVLDCRLREIVAAINHNTRELAKLGRKVEGVTWETKRVADTKDQNGKGKAMPKESEEQEESDRMDREDGEDEESGDKDWDVEVARAPGINHQ